MGKLPKTISRHNITTYSFGYCDKNMNNNEFFRGRVHRRLHNNKFCCFRCCCAYLSFLEAPLPIAYYPLAITWNLSKREPYRLQRMACCAYCVHLLCLLPILAFLRCRGTRKCSNNKQISLSKLEKSSDKSTKISH